MDKERNNDTLDINAKYKDMMYVSKRIVEHHEFVTDDSCEPPIFVCLAYDVKNYLPKLLKENQELKNQQKEFISYLEKEIVDCRAGSSQYYSAIEHLKLYNKVIGGDK